MSEAQKKHKAAGERLCQKCAEERENKVRRENAQAANRKREAEANERKRVGTMRCSNDGCESEFREGAEMSEAQKKRKAAGERLCKKCALDRENTVLRANYEAGNRKRKAEAEAKPLTSVAGGKPFSDTKHLKQKQEKDHRGAREIKVVCGGCKELGFTARSC